MTATDIVAPVGSVDEYANSAAGASVANGRHRYDKARILIQHKTVVGRTAATVGVNSNVACIVHSVVQGRCAVAFQHHCCATSDGWVRTSQYQSLIYIAFGFKQDVVDANTAEKLELGAAIAVGLACQPIRIGSGIVHIGYAADT